QFFESASRIPEQLLHFVENFALLGGFFFKAALRGTQRFAFLLQSFNILGQAPERFGDWVGEIRRVEVDNRAARRRMLRLVPYNSARDAHHSGVWWPRKIRRTA